MTKKKGYEEVRIPIVKAPGFKEGNYLIKYLSVFGSLIWMLGEKLISKESLPEWTHPAFEGLVSLNRIQSRVYESVFYGSDNVLLCAPTGV